MMKDEDVQILKDFAAKVRRVFPEARIWAFGSRARGNADLDSDLDVCVVLDRVDHRIRTRISDVSWEVGFNRGILIATVVFSRELFDHGPLSASPFVRNIIEEGVAA